MIQAEDLVGDLFDATGDAISVLRAERCEGLQDEHIESATEKIQFFLIAHVGKRQELMLVVNREDFVAHPKQQNGRC